jgi:hypothetical protein
MRPFVAPLYIDTYTETDFHFPCAIGVTKRNICPICPVRLVAAEKKILKQF